MRIRGRKILDDALVLMSTDPPAAAKDRDVSPGLDPRHDGLKKAARQVLGALAKARWTGPENIHRLRADIADTSSGRIIGFRVGDYMRLNVIVHTWATEELDGEVEIVWFGRANPGSWSARRGGNT